VPIPSANGASPRVLILFSDTGGGHRAAARALTDALKQLDPRCVVTVADPLITQGPEVVRRLASLYSPLIQRSRVAWGAVYHSSNTKPTFAAIRAVFGRGVRNAISELLQQHDPDVILSVHPLLNHVAHQAIQKGRRPRALMTVITDLVDFHRGWTFSQADLVVAPTELARKVALRRRVPADRVKLLGLPVDLRFRPPAPGEKLALRRRFGLEETRFTVLAMGGAAGVGNLLKQVRVLAWEPHQWQVVAVCGRNEKLRRRLARVRFAPKLFGSITLERLVDIEPLWRPLLTALSAQLDVSWIATAEPDRGWFPGQVSVAEPARPKVIRGEVCADPLQ